MGIHCATVGPVGAFNLKLYWILRLNGFSITGGDGDLVAMGDARGRKVLGLYDRGSADLVAIKCEQSLAEHIADGGENG